MSDARQDRSGEARPAASKALDEEVARADLYGLLAALYYAPPEPALLAHLRVAGMQAEGPNAAPESTEPSFLASPWSALVETARNLSDAEIHDEFDTLFGGVGKPEVYLYGSHYLSGFLNERPLAQLRETLAELGLERSESVSETEDHVACLCEVMRYLIAGDDVEIANLTRQRAFFSAQIQPWVNDLCDALAAHPAARFYAALAGLTRAFMSVESQGFDMLDA